MINEIIEEVARLTGKESAEIAEAHKEGENDWKEGTAKSLLGEINEYWKGNLESQRLRGQKEAHTQWRKGMKGSLDVEVQDPKDLPGIVEHLEKTYTKEVKVPVELEPSAALENPEIKGLIEERVNNGLAEKLEERVASWQEKITAAENKAESIRQEYDVKDLMSSVYSTVDRVLTNPKNKVKLGDKSEERAAKIKKYKTRMINPEMFGRDDQGKVVPVDDKGEQLRDGDFKLIDLDRFILQDQPFGIHDQDPNTSSPTVTTQTPNKSVPAGSIEQLRENIRQAGIAKDFKAQGELQKALLAKLEEAQ